MINDICIDHRVVISIKNGSIVIYILRTNFEQKFGCPRLVDGYLIELGVHRAAHSVTTEQTFGGSIRVMAFFGLSVQQKIRWKLAKP